MKIDFAQVITPQARRAQLHSNAITAIDAAHADFLRNLTGQATGEERDTWETKVSAAAFIRGASGPEIEANIALLNEDHVDAFDDLLSLVDDIGEDIEDLRALSATILLKSRSYKHLVGRAARFRREAKDAIALATGDGTPIADVPAAITAVFAQMSAEVAAAVQLWQNQSA